MEITNQDDRGDFLENDAFITIVKIINDPDQGALEIRKIVALDSSLRAGVIDRMVMKMRQDEVPRDYIEAVELLKNERVVEIIKKEFIDPD